MAHWTVILKECPDASRASVAVFIGRAFSLKESTCGAIAGAAPIVLLHELSREEALVCSLSLAGLERLGAQVEYTERSTADLPKIDWPRRPQLFKRDLAEHVADLQLEVALGDGRQASLLELIGRRFAAPEQVPVAAPSSAHEAGPKQEFRGIQLPEITPFSNPVLPSGGGSAAQPAAGGNDDPMSRLNELFPEEEASGLMPNNQDITNILNRLLPDEDGAGGAGAPTPPPGHTTSSGRTPVGGAATQGWAVFLAKIADEARRTKAVPLIAELAHLSNEDAEALSKKVIIPVLKGATKDDAEAAKAKFAKIGILARVKGPEG